MRITCEPMGAEGRFNYAYRICGTTIRQMSSQPLLAKKENLPDYAAAVGVTYDVPWTFKPFCFGNVSTVIF